VDDQPDASWPALPDVGSPDRALPDLASPDCPTIGDGASQMGWRVASTLATPLFGVACVSGHLYVAGAKGTLLHHGPGSAPCAPFETQQVPTQADLLTVTFADLSYGATAGRDPTIWETRDGGKTWVIAPQCGDVEFDVFHALHLHSASKGYGVGNASSQAGGAYKIYAGKTWICPNQTFANQDFLGTFRREDLGWIVGDTKGRIYHTPDEAVSWFYTDMPLVKPMRDVFFTAPMVGIIVGDEGIILRSDDGKGLDWSQVTTLGTDDLTDVYFFDDHRGWVVGHAGTIMYTEDAGQSWSYQSAPTTERLSGICFTSASDGWAVGEAGTVLFTTTGGE